MCLISGRRYPAEPMSIVGRQPEKKKKKEKGKKKKEKKEKKTNK